MVVWCIWNQACDHILRRLNRLRAMEHCHRRSRPVAPQIYPLPLGFVGQAGFRGDGPSVVNLKYASTLRHGPERISNSKTTLDGGAVSTCRAGQQQPFQNLLPAEPFATCASCCRSLAMAGCPCFRAPCANSLKVQPCLNPRNPCTA